MTTHLRRILPILALVAAGSAPLPAQPAPSLDRRTVARVIALNGLIGGTTAALRAGISGKDVRKPFLLGVLGGAGYGAGKTLGSRGHVAAAVVGNVTTGIGSSVVANGGRGAGWADELMVPVGPLRARFFRRERDRFALSVNATETVVAISTFAHRDLNIDWKRSAAAGAFVFVTDGRHIRFRGRTAGGVANTSVVVVDEFFPDADLILRHEIAHVHQHWFMQENWGKPMEDAVRRVGFVGRWIPSWIELGVAVPMLDVAATNAFGYPGPLDRMQESEAGTLQRR